MKFVQFSPTFISAFIAFIIAFLTITALQPNPTRAFDLLDNFENVQILAGLAEPSSFAFSPDGRLFISERITGRLRVAEYDGAVDAWAFTEEPFYTFDIPKDEAGEPQARRSAGLRDITFDPDFANNGFIYAFYMKNDLLQNWVVRLKADSMNPDVADAIYGEEFLISLPFNDTFASGSHNGGALEFGPDGTLFITTGDGWTGEFEGDPVQSLTSFTGKVLRIHPDGTIPTDNPFYTQTTGAYRAIYALGLRNPYAMSKNPISGKLYINEARGNNKASVYVVQAGANYGHEANTDSDLGTPVAKWADASLAGGELITGGAWYPEEGPFPQEFHGGYFVPLWGSNAVDRGQISVIHSETITTVRLFEGNVGLSTEPPVKPVMTRIGPDGNLYYMLTTYQTDSGTIQMVRYTLQQTVEAPLFTPTGGTFQEPIPVVLTSSTPGSTVHYTLDGSEPHPQSPQYTAPILLSNSAILKAKAFKEHWNPSSTSSASFVIGIGEPNLPPLVDAGPNQRTLVGRSTTLDGSGTNDPDGNDDLLHDESWIQISGPPTTILDASEEIAYFTPETPGIYVFELTVSDGDDVDTDRVTIGAYEMESCGVDGLQALYTFSEGRGTRIRDRSGIQPVLDLTILSENTSWIDEGGLAVDGTTTILSSGPAAKLISASQESNELSVELWIKPTSVTPNVSGRIFTISAGTLARNLTIGQGQFGSAPSDVFDFRVRTSSAATDNNGQPALATEEGSVTTELIHLVYTRQFTGTTTIYMNGVPAQSRAISGDLSNWDPTYSLGLSNEMDGSRPWMGEYHRVAYYNCALAQSDIFTNFSVGTHAAELDVPQPKPNVTSTATPTATISITPTVSPTVTPTSTPTSRPTPTSTPLPSDELPPTPDPYPGPNDDVRDNDINYQIFLPDVSFGTR
ncbi:MAG: PQQ-dependent sugar dehydrogenase [Chloroflexota bacterium]